MIISKTPLRISFCGGGTDLPGYYMKKAGRVISTTIDKYIYVTVAPKFDGRVSVRYSRTENVDDVEDLDHTIIRECLREFGIKSGIEIVTISDVPMNGTGLGSSSALTVGLLNALREYTGNVWHGVAAAEKAFDIEVNRLGAPIGKQDQYAAFVGGFNHMIFSKSAVGIENIRKGSAVSGKDGISRKKISCLCPDVDINLRKVAWLERSVMLFWLDRPRDGNAILKEQSAGIEGKMDVYDRSIDAVQEFLRWFDDGVADLDVGDILDRAWKTKKEYCEKISDSYIDQTYDRAKSAGAIGGKLLGAGGGGFLMLVVPEFAQDDVRRALHPLKEMPIKFTETGSEVIYGGC